MNICLIAQITPSPQYGGGKAQYYLAQEWKRNGHTVQLFGFETLRTYSIEKGYITKKESVQAAFAAFLEHEGNDYDVVDFDFSLGLKQPSAHYRNTLLVARTVLFLPCKHSYQFPTKGSILARIKSTLRGPHLAWQNKQKNDYRLRSLANCDLLNVPSTHAQTRALELGVEGERLCHFPYALGADERSDLLGLSRTALYSHQIVFLGSFDFRKGCLDLCKIFHLIRKSIPDAQLTLLGAKGLFQDALQIKGHFYEEDRSHVDVKLQFDTNTLTTELTGIQLALFPSYLEGLPFSVQETLAAGIPTLGYRTPGTADLLPDNWLFEKGDVAALSNGAIHLMNTGDQSDSARKQISHLQWPNIAQSTLQRYEQKLALKHAQL